jgi:hypothetical protein
MRAPVIILSASLWSSSQSPRNSSHLELILLVAFGLTAECLRDDVARHFATAGNLLKSLGLRRCQRRRN